MGTTGTIMGTSRFLKEKNPDVRIIGLQPEDGASIPGSSPHNLRGSIYVRVLDEGRA